jgi:hypothetical protein
MHLWEIIRIQFYGSWELFGAFMVFGKILWGFGIIWEFYDLRGTNIEKHNECDKLIMLIEGLSNLR